METPVISIVILVGPKRRKTLLLCLRSIMRSSYKSYEILVVNNDSEADSIEKMVRIVKNARLINLPENTGIFGFSVGFANAKGKYILALDDDAEIEKDTLQKIVAYFSKAPKDVAILTLNQYEPKKKFFYYQHYISLGLTDVFTFVNGASVFRKEIFKEVGFFDHSFFCWVHEDDFAIRVIDKGFHIHFVKEILIYHHEDFSLRPFKYTMIFRNKVWFNLKHFPLFLLPLLFLKDLAWFLSISPLKQRNFRSYWLLVKGTIWGILSSHVVLRKRRVVSYETQKKLYNYYFFLFRNILKKSHTTRVLTYKQG